MQIYRRFRTCYKWLAIFFYELTSYLLLLHKKLGFCNGEVFVDLTKFEYLRSSKPVNDTPKFYWDEAEPDAEKEKK